LQLEPLETIEAVAVERQRTKEWRLAIEDDDGLTVDREQRLPALDDRTLRSEPGELAGPGVDDGADGRLVAEAERACHGLGLHERRAHDLGRGRWQAGTGLRLRGRRRRHARERHTRSAESDQHGADAEEPDRHQRLTMTPPRGPAPPPG